MGHFGVIVAKKADKSAKSRGLKLVTFEMDAGKWQAFRIHAIKSGKNASELLREMVDRELKAKK